jgi:predicted outer membrane protein
LGASVRRPAAGARTSSATELRTEFDIEAARIILDHSKAKVTQVYAEPDMSRAAAVAVKIG